MGSIILLQRGEAPDPQCGSEGLVARPLATGHQPDLPVAQGHGLGIDVTLDQVDSVAMQIIHLFSGSTPSAIISMPDLRPKVMVASSTLRLRSSVPMVSTNILSILIRRMPSRLQVLAASRCGSSSLEVEAPLLQSCDLRHGPWMCLGSRR